MALNLNNIVVLVGGVGGAKIAHGLAQILKPENLIVIVNTGDDFWHYDLKICPDLDTVMYTLAGWVDKTHGWGISGDTTNTLEALSRYGEAPWFRLGDRDIATHLIRSQALRAGETLTDVTRRLTQGAQILHTVLPMTDSEVPTIVDTEEYGELEFQVYFVKHLWQPTLKTIRYTNIENAKISEPIRVAIENADAILVAPSNPWLSIAPILGVGGMREALMARQVPRVAVSPIVDGQAIKGPAAKIMAELGYGEVSARTVAAYYGELINGFVYDKRDSDLQIDIQGLQTVMLDTVMSTDESRATLAQQIIDWIAKW